MFHDSGHLVSPEDVVNCLQSFCCDRNVDPFKRIHVLQTVEQVSRYIFKLCMVYLLLCKLLYKLKFSYRLLCSALAVWNLLCRSVLECPFQVF